MQELSFPLPHFQPLHFRPCLFFHSRIFSPCMPGFPLPHFQSPHYSTSQLLGLYLLNVSSAGLKPVVGFHEWWKGLCSKLLLRYYWLYFGCCSDWLLTVVAPANNQSKEVEYPGYMPGQAVQVFLIVACCWYSWLKVLVFANVTKRG